MIEPDTVIEPYDLAMTDLSAEDQRWRARQIENQFHRFWVDFCEFERGPSAFTVATSKPRVVLLASQLYFGAVSTLPGMNGAAPVYYATKKGAEVLASYFGDDSFLATNTKHPRADRLAHWIAINDTRMLIEAAAERLDGVTLVSWVTEWETINKDDAKTGTILLAHATVRNAAAVLLP